MILWFAGTFSLFHLGVLMKAPALAGYDSHKQKKERMLCGYDRREAAKFALCGERIKSVGCLPEKSIYRTQTQCAGNYERRKN